jgi:prevent-host-death family protein
MKPIDVPVAELRQNFAAALARVRAGESLRITSRGRVIARLEPALDERTAAESRMAQFRATAVLGDIVSPVEAVWSTAPRRPAARSGGLPRAAGKRAS